MHIEPVTIVLPAGFEALRTAAVAEGYSHIETLWSEWESGANRFTKPGEQLLAAFDGTKLAGVGGITLDFAILGALRMRRFYVRRDFRGTGTGRLLAETLLAAARPFAKDIVVFAPTPAASAFWEAMGFVPDDRDKHSHILRA